MAKATQKVEGGYSFDFGPSTAYPFYTDKEKYKPIITPDGGWLQSMS